MQTKKTINSLRVPFHHRNSKITVFVVLMPFLLSFTSSSFYYYLGCNIYPHTLPVCVPHGNLLFSIPCPLRPVMYCQLSFLLGGYGTVFRTGIILRTVPRTVVLSDHVGTVRYQLPRFVSPCRHQSQGSFFSTLFS